MEHCKKLRCQPQVGHITRFGDCKHTCGTKKGENSREDASEKRNCSHSACSVHLKGVNDVVERGLENHEKPRTDQDGTDTWSEGLSA